MCTEVSTDKIRIVRKSDTTFISVMNPTDNQWVEVELTALHHEHILLALADKRTLDAWTLLDYITIQRDQNNQRENRDYAVEEILGRHSSRRFERQQEKKHHNAATWMW